ncbi:MAG TPA: type II secretion system protein GspL [Burkholderiaceae bacterium]|nr:type II secretion system protein GspL [Burkholderiaceae bacterium]
MRQHLRLALPPLPSLTSDTGVAFALVDRAGRLARAGHLPLAEVGAQTRSEPVYAILHPDDAIVAGITVPPVSAQRLSAAVAGCIEPMALSDLEELSVAHSARAADGAVTVAWTARRPLESAWALLAEAGLNIVAFIPHSLALPPGDPHVSAPLALPAGPRWLAPLPDWSLASDALRPSSVSGRWGRAIRWTVAAAAVWLIGLNWYAAQLGDRVSGLRQGMQDAVMQAFPQVPVVIDPIRQAQHQRDALRLAQGTPADDDFMPLALATARVLDFAQSHVRKLAYENGVLTLTLAEGYLPPANEAALAQSASVHRLSLKKDDTQAYVWHAQRLVQGEPSARRP